MNTLITVKPPKFEIINERSVVSVEVSNFNHSNILWFSVAGLNEHSISLDSTPFAIALLMPAMSKGCDIFIHGKTSSEIAYTLRSEIQPLLIQVFPFLHKVTIDFESLFIPEKTGKNGITAISAGIDSWFTIQELALGESTGFISHVLLNNVGAFGRNSKSSEIFNVKVNSIKEIADSIKLPLISVDSNLDNFHEEPLKFVGTHTLRNTAIAHLLSKSFGTFYYASAYSYKDISLVQNKEMGHADPVILGMLSDGRILCKPHGSHATRALKTKQVLQNTTATINLDVCTNRKLESSKNCGQCEKCIRTLATADAHSLLSSIEKAFETQHYKKNKAWVVSKIISDPSPLSTEIHNLLISKKSIPFLSKLLALTQIPRILVYRKIISRKIRSSLLNS